MDISKIISELLATEPHPDAFPPEDQTVPCVWIDNDPPGWTVTTFSSATLDEEDRKWIWRQIADAIESTVSEMGYGLQAKVFPPQTFPDGTRVQGAVHFRYPPPESRMASTHWWEAMTDELPAINAALYERIVFGWGEYRAQKLAKSNRSNPEARKAKQLAAIEAAKARQKRRPPSPPRMGR